jgi:hypothetical protein
MRVGGRILFQARPASDGRATILIKQLLHSKPDVSRSLAVLMCLASVTVCLTYAYCRSGLPDWWRDYGGGIPYVLFWIAFWFMIFPFRRCVLLICIFATTFTCFLEFMQLWKPDWLTQLRGTRFGAALLGSGFTWSDFPPYFIGGALGYSILMRFAIRNQRQPKEHGNSQ